MSAFAAIFPLVPFYKTPADAGWRNTKPGQHTKTRDHGIALQARELIIDCDPRNYPKDEQGNMVRDMLTELWNAHLSKAPTRAVKTPRGGWHLYYMMPAAKDVRKNQPGWTGIDFLTNKRYVVGAGSQTIFDADKEQVDGVYELINDVPVAELPRALWDLLEEQADRLDTASVDFTLFHLGEFTAECQQFPAAAAGNRNNTAFKLCCKGRDKALPLDQVYAALRDNWDIRNTPPLGDSELWRTCESAYKTAKNSIGCDTVQSKFAAPEKPPEVIPQQPNNVVSIQSFQHDRVISTIHQKQLVYNKDKNGNVIGPKNTQGNVIYYLREDAAWKNRIFYNQFADTIEIKGRPDWRLDQMNKQEDLDQNDIAYIQAWFSAVDTIRLEVPENRLWNALIAAATHYHPVRDYLSKLTWDGVERLDTFLPDTAGCENTPYTRTAGRKMLISAVKRILEPGCKQDYVLVLESLQGEKKSQWVEELARPWGSTGELQQGDKDTYQNMRGKWIIELPEIDSTFTKQHYSWLKKIISTPCDTYRPSYERRAKTVPRESIFIATINPNAVNQYLKDEENRRYWPIKTGRLDLEKLTECKDQYFAEALHAYYAMEKSYIDDTTILAAIRDEQDRRRVVHPWQDILRAWLTGRKECSPLEAYAALGFVGKELTSSHRATMYGVMKNLGWGYDAMVGGGKWSKKVLTFEDLI